MLYIKVFILFTRSCNNLKGFLKVLIVLTVTKSEPLTMIRTQPLLILSILLMVTGFSAGNGKSIRLQCLVLSRL
jgi:hypothetical protein